MTELEKGRLEACKLIRKILNTDKNGGCGWMYAFEELAKIDEIETSSKVLDSEDWQYMMKLITQLRTSNSLRDASRLMKESATVIEELLGCG